MEPVYSSMPTMPTGEANQRPGSVTASPATPAGEPNARPRAASLPADGASLLLGSYREGATLGHRTPLWLKMLIFVGLGVAFALTGWQWALGLAVLSIILASLSGVTARDMGRILYSLRWILLLLVAYYVLWGGVATGVDVLCTMLSAFMLSRAVLTSTPLPVLLDGAVRACAPLRLVGVSPQRVGLAIALLIRSVPQVLTIWSSLSRAADARGMSRRSRWRLLIPLVVQTVAYAHATGDALTARGLDRL
ncbi:MAG: energy-coupling factor transporter transmembrane component T [Rothia sp. (in: high G+C Gram-positive bacteria)]|uniref:energy-coupling factor transporter transmembrane component T n=1 Tax=Rothia sp. (in: high G+C Gram-positive bacteria) TaxID=1885016 RepID=UPI0026DEAB3C|nr:energy-coupling factor transporter transmembrane component T [Rothia sp. (in: high G+C Gram-positive bacteria)]MDO5750711.1 energy-coupling factor transporter transmembrane component T [Rothia sp. (in: high G+C Gram-positive bacteria)]